MEAKILIFGYNEEENNKIKNFCLKNHFPEPVILCQSHKKILIKDLLINRYEPQDCIVRQDNLILFNKLPNYEISRFIDLFKKEGLRIPLWAAVTEHSINWSLEELLTELKKEREEFEKAKKQAEKDKK